MHISHLTLKIVLKVKVKVAERKNIYDFLLVFNSNFILNCFQVIAIERYTYSHLTLKVVLKVKIKVTKMQPIYDFLLVLYSNYAHILHSLLVIVHITPSCTSAYKLICIIGQIYVKLTPFEQTLLTML